MLADDSSGSSAEQTPLNLCGVEVPLYAGVVGAAENLGLQSKNGLVQTTAFVSTKAAILDAVHLIGIGDGLATLDPMAFQMAQLKRQVEEKNKKL